MPGPYASVCLNAFHSYLLTPHSFQVLTMPQTPKLSPQQKVALVEKIKAGEISRQAAAQSVGVSNTTVRQWLRIYESEGADGLAPREKSRHLTAEEKQAAVAEYLAGGVSLFDVCKKYGIRSPQNLQKLVEKAQAGRRAARLPRRVPPQGRRVHHRRGPGKDRAGMSGRRLRLRRSCVKI